MRCDLSIVATSRNDDHGGNLLHRMQLFVRGLLEQCRRHQLDAELILVDWNPPPDKPKLKEALSYPVQNGRCDVRIIEVPPEVHSRFKYGDQLPLFQMIAKNVGIRRARAPFVLATNIDILFSDEIMRFLCSQRLNRRRMYRIDRYDVKPNVPADVPIEQQLEFCRNNVLRVHERRKPDYAPAHFELLSRGPFPSAWRDWHRWPSTDAVRGLVQGDRHYLKDLWLLSQLRFEELQGHRFPNTLSGYFMLDLPVNLHTNACGDFTLLHSRYWQKVRGYPEFTSYCMHVDALLCYMAHHAGALEEVLADPMRIYHIDHGTGSGDGAGAWRASAAPQSGRTPQTNGGAGGDKATASISRVTSDQLTAWAREMRRAGRPLMFNSEDWGLAREELPETVIQARD